MVENIKIGKVQVRKYGSIHEFEEFINTTPLNEVFRWASLASSRVEKNGGWAGTKSYEEATELLKHGADDLSKRLEKMYQVKADKIENSTRQKSLYDVCGYQASVPRYLQGIPTSMINTKKVPAKQKVLTFNKDISYHAGFTVEQILDESAKALAIIKKLETQGYRVNLNLCWCSVITGNEVACKIRIKNAGERLNISKMAFVMAHPSMLRRILFRWLEVNPDVTNKRYSSCYGIPQSIDFMKEKGEYTLPKEIHNIEDVIASFGF